MAKNDAMSRLESGTQIKPIWSGVSPTIDRKTTVEESFKIAGLDWLVEKEPVFMSDGRGNFIKVPNYSITSRQDKDKGDVDRILGMVGSRYEQIQNIDAFSVINAVMEKSGAKVATAGQLKGGQIVYLMIEFPEQIQVKDDQLSRFLMIGNNHGGLASMVGLFTSVRVVCLNTYNLAVRTAKSGIKVRHTRNSGAQLIEASRILQESDKYYNEIVDVYQRLADYKIDAAFKTAYLKALIPDPKSENITRAENSREMINALFQRYQAGQGSDATKGSAYGILQSVIEYSQYYRSARGENENEKSASRFNSQIFGSGGAFIQNGFNLLLRATGIETGSQQAQGESLVEEAIGQN